MRNSNTKIGIIIIVVFLVLFMLLTVINLGLNASQSTENTKNICENSISTQVEIEASNPYDAYSTTIPTENSSSGINNANNTLPSTENSSKPILNNRK